MNIGPGNIEALLLDALEGRLSAADAELVWAALEAHPEWGVSWDFNDRDLPRLSPGEVPAMDWSGLKKEVVTDTEIRQALRRDRDLHTLDSDVKQSLHRRQEQSLWRYWAAAASVALLVWLAWPTSDRGDVPSIAGTVMVSTDTSSIIPSPPIAPIQQLADEHPSTSLGEGPSKALEEHKLIEHCVGTPEQIQEEVLPKILPLSEEEWNIAQGNDTTSLEAPLALPFELTPTFNTALIEEAHPLRSGTDSALSAQTKSNTYTPLAWLKMKAGQIAQRAEADGTLPTVRRDQHSFEMHWGSLSINAH